MSFIKHAFLNILNGYKKNISIKNLLNQQASCFVFLIILICSTSVSQTTLTIQPDGNDGKDALLYSNSVNTNLGYEDGFFAIAWTFSGTPGIYRSLVDFDLTIIPDGATVNYALLYLYNDADAVICGGEHMSYTGSNMSMLQRVVEPWDENTVTWNNQPIAISTNQVLVPQSTDSHQDYSIDVTDLVQDMIDHPSSSFGFLYKLYVEDHFRSMVFASSDHHDPTLHPKIVINYTGANAFTLGSDTVLCEGEVLTLDATTSNAGYVWQDNSSGPTYVVYQPGLYWVNIIGSWGTITDSINVYYKPSPVVDLGNDTTLCYGGSIVLDAGNPAASYIWSTGESTQKIKVYSGEQTIWVNVDLNGCKTSDTIKIFQCQHIKGCVIDVPKAFSPNGDGQNDKLYVRGSDFESFEFVLYNRWGEQVFSTKDINKAWDGTYKGMRQESEVYFYILKANCVNGEKVIKNGNITLLY